MREQLEQWQRLVSEATHLVRRHPNLLFQQAANQPDSSLPALAAQTRLTAGLERRPWLQWVNKPQERSRCVMTLAGHSGDVDAVAYSPDGRQIVSTGSYDRTLKLWNAETGAEFATVKDAKSVHACAYSADGLSIVYASGALLHICDSKTLTNICTLRGHSDVVWACALSPDSRRVVSGSKDKTIRVWDSSTGAEIFRLTFDHEVRSCTYSPDGQRIVVASGEWIRIVDGASGTELCRVRGVEPCAFSPDGSRIVAGWREMSWRSSWRSRTLKVWDLTKATEVASVLVTGAKACAYSPDGSWIISGSWDGTLSVWDAASGAHMETLRGHALGVAACAFSPDGCRIVSGSADRTVKIWEADAVLSGTQPPMDIDQVLGCALSPDTRHVVLLGGSAPEVWDVAAGVRVMTLKGHRGTVFECSYAPHGRELASAGGDKTVRVWDTESGIERHKVSGRVTACRYSPDGRRLMVAYDDGTAHAWDPADMRITLELAGNTGKVRSCAFSPDGCRIILAGSRAIDVWDAASSDIFVATPLATYTARSRKIEACDYSPDGRLIAIADGRALHVWDSLTGETIATTSEHSSIVESCAYSPDSRYLVTAFQDGTLRIWDGRTGVELWSTQLEATLRRNSACYSRDGERVLAKSGGGLTVWDSRLARGIAMFFDRSVSAFVEGVRHGDIVVGDLSGQAQILRLMGMQVSPVVATCVHLYNFDTARWDDHPTVHCDGCARRFVPSSCVLDEIASIARITGLSPDQPAVIALPEKTWTESRLVTNCPDCGLAIRINPFVVDNRWS